MLALTGDDDDEDSDGDDSERTLTGREMLSKVLTGSLERGLRGANIWIQYILFYSLYLYFWFL